MSAVAFSNSRPMRIAPVGQASTQSPQSVQESMRQTYFPRTFFPARLFVQSTEIEALGQAFSQSPQAMQSWSPFASWTISRFPRNRSVIFSVARFSGYCSVTIREGRRK